MLLLGIALILGSAWLYKKIKHNRSECSQLAFYLLPFTF
jgi:flagellar biogenesis protein FliO